MSHYLIGIDLGTTNNTVSYIETDKAEVTPWAISQFVSNGTLEDKNSYPSFLYLPLDKECEENSFALPWDASSPVLTGELALKKSREIPERVIHSAKSWLCYQGDTPKLPWASSIEEKLSAVEVLTHYLKHIQSSWDYQNNEHPFKEQTLCITVPASFDPKAREAVMEAARNASYPEFLLLEEPQAAFYAWLESHEESWREALSVDDTVLVVDIGGGTTDFSLISVGEEEGSLSLKREAVGDHLLLGGDNMDLTLAMLAKQQFEQEGQTIDTWQFQDLVAKCRHAKERFLGAEAPESIELTIQGKSSSFIASSLSTTLEKEKALSILLEGFFPLVNFEEKPSEGPLSALAQQGLNYSKDPRVSAHLAQFLSRSGALPSHILFNGGVLKSTAIRKRLEDLLEAWAKELELKTPIILEETDLDQAVSAGASYYCKAKAGEGIRIRAGSAHSYFIGIEEAMPAIPGLSPPLKALCVVPFGLEEGSELEIPNQTFQLITNTPTRFRFFSLASEKLSNGREISTGDYVANWERELQELAPLEVDITSADGEKVQAVTLQSRLTELGVLEIWCHSNSGEKWQFSFDAREPSEVEATV